MKKSLIYISFAIFLCFYLGCQQTKKKLENDDKPLFTEHDYKAHLKFLADDLLEGRAPGVRGGDIAALYIASQFEAAGLQPISEENGYFQQVSFFGASTDYKTLDFRMTSKNKNSTSIATEEIILNSQLSQNDIFLEEELTFVGYGIDAPEYDWDDFKDVDVTGKTLVMLLGSPRSEQTEFGNEGKPFYDFPFYKEPIAHIKGAKGLIMVYSDTEAPWPPFSNFRNFMTSEQIILDDRPFNPLHIYGYISIPALEAGLSLVGMTFDELKQKADSRDFRPFPLELNAEIKFKQDYRKFTSPNVIGLLPGTSSSDEAVIYMAHYDHVGIGRPVNGDNIYNGARDNACGTSTILCIARAFALRPPTKRSIIFIGLTAEEFGMLGSTYYVTNPLVPFEKTVIGINMDGDYFYGRLDGFEMFPIQYTNAVQTIEKLGKEHGLELNYGGVDSEGLAFRTDHFPFCSQGVVALSFWQTGELLDITEEEYIDLKNEVGDWWHLPTDEIYPFWRYEGNIQNMEVLYHIGQYYANNGEKPSLNPENPFNAPKRIFEMLYKDINKHN